MRKCPKCEIEKSNNDFYQRSDGRYQSYCKKCLLKVQRDRWKSRKLAAALLFGGKCSICGYAKNLASFDFHHIDPNEKEFIWKEVVKRPWKEVVAELQKCTMLCRNCHGELHNPEMSLELIDVENANKSLNKDAHSLFDGLEPKLRKLVATGVCPQCGENVFGTKYCSTKCSSLSQRKVVRPTAVQLTEDLKSLSWVAVGNKYGVSDNAVRKWAKLYGLVV